MKDGYILFYDSGIGGLTTLKETIHFLPNEKFIYFADNKNCPYGNKDREEIVRLVCEALKRLLNRFNIKLVVFACNTITTAAIDEIRRLFKVLIVGTEPAVLLAGRENKRGNILVLSTLATASQKRYKELLKRSPAVAISLPIKNLARDIEDHFLCRKELEMNKYISLIEREKEKNDIGCVVLGCTHYCFLKKELEKALEVKVFDGNFGVAKRAKSVLHERGLESENGRGRVLVLTTDGGKLNGKFFNLLSQL